MSNLTNKEYFNLYNTLSNDRIEKLLYQTDDSLEDEYDHIDCLLEDIIENVKDDVVKTNLLHISFKLYALIEKLPFEYKDHLMQIYDALKAERKNIENVSKNTIKIVNEIQNNINELY